MTPHYFFTTLLFFPLILHISTHLWFLAVYILHSLNAFFFKPPSSLFQECPSANQKHSLCRHINFYWCQQLLKKFLFNTLPFGSHLTWNRCTIVQLTILQNFTLTSDTRNQTRQIREEKKSITNNTSLPRNLENGCYNWNISCDRKVIIYFCNALNGFIFQLPVRTTCYCTPGFVIWHRCFIF